MTNSTGYRGLIAYDVDGTIMGPEGVLPSTIEATAEAAAAGYLSAISTGRHIGATVHAAYELQAPPGWAICSNGSVVIQLGEEYEGGWRTAHLEEFDPSAALETVLAAHPDAFVAVEWEGIMHRANRDFPGGVMDRSLEVLPLTELLSRKATRVVIYAPGADSQDFIAAAAEVGLRGVTYSTGIEGWVDVTPPGISKATGLEWLCQQVGVARQNVMAIGDGLNDLEMLEWAGHGVAMANGEPETHEIADAIAGDFLEDGAAAAVRDFVRSRG